MEDLAEKLWWLVFLLLWVVPRIAKAFMKRKPRTVVPSPPPPQVIEAPPVDPFEAQPAVELEPALDRDELERLLDRARQLQNQVDGQVRRCKLHRGASSRLLPTLETRGVEPIGDVISALEERSAGSTGLSQRDALAFETAIDRIEDELALVSRVVEQRVRVDRAELLDLLDLPAQDCLTPYLVHARRLDLPYTADRAVVLVDPAGPEAAPWLADPDLAPVVLHERALERAAEWTEIAPQIAWAVLRGTPGLVDQIGRELGVPDAGSAIAYFQTTGRLGFTTLAAGWLNRIIADTCAAVQLGPAYAAHLALAGTDSEARAVALSAWIDDRFNFGPPPLHVRMFLVCHTLERIGFSEEAQARWKSWNSELGEPSAISLESTRFPPIQLPLDRILETIAGVVDGVLEKPLGALGGYPLGHIPGLRCDVEIYETMGEIARSLGEGHPINESPRLLLGGLALAIERSGHLEQRIRKAVLASLAGHGETAAGQRGAVPAGRPADFRSALGQPGFVPRAVALGAALAPIRGGRGLRLR